MVETKDNDLIKNIVANNNIVDIIGSYINLEHKGKNFFGVCPFHADHSPSMSVSPEKQIFKCFSCGASGNAITFLMDYLGIPFKEAIKVLADNAGIILDSSFTKKKVNNEIDELYKVNELAKDIFKNNLVSTKGLEAREYLHSRNLSDETIKYFNIGLSLEDGLYKSLSKKYSVSLLSDIDLCKDYGDSVKDTFIHRIIFPISDIDNNIIGFTGRIYKPKDKDESKYLNTRETKIFKKGLILYNLNNAKEFIRKSREIIICEGQMDTIRLHTIGYKNAVSLSGTSITREQIEMISKFKANIILNLDQDEAGRQATVTIGNIFESMGLNVNVIVFSESKDTDELVSKKGKSSFDNAYKNKVPFINFKLDYLKKGINLNDTVELAKYINEVINNLNTLNDPILLDLKIKELSHDYGLDEGTIRSKIKKKEKVSIVKEVKEKKRYNKYEKLEIRIINLMLENTDVIRIYEKNLGFLATDKMTKLANEIVNFRIKNKGFDLSEFITYTYTLEGLSDTLKEVMSNNDLGEYTDEEIDDAVMEIKKYSVEKQIRNLKTKLKESLDIEEKKKLLKKIENMKKEVLTW